MDLMVLTDAELISLGCRLNGGTFGRDAARMNKLAKVAHLRDLMATKHGDRGKALLEGAALSVLAARKGTQPHTPGAAPVPEPGPVLDLGNAPDEPGDEEPGDGGEGVGIGAGEPVPSPLGAPDGEPDGDAEGEGDEGAEDAPGRPADLLEARVRELIEEGLEAATEGTAEQIAATIEERLGDAIATVRAELGAREPRKVESTLRIPALPAPVRTDDKHPIYAKGLALLALPPELRHGWGLCLVGPAGSVKSTLWTQWAQALGDLPFGTTSCSADMSRGVVEGRILPIGDGRYVPSELIRMMQAGKGVFLFDEFDAASPEIILCANPLLANGGMHAEPRSFANLPTYVPKDPDFHVGANMNTWGTGATSTYMGRAAQDGASMDRWLTLHVDHPKHLWAGLLGCPDAYQAPEPWQPVNRTDEDYARDLRRLFHWLDKLEQRVAELSAQGAMRRTVSIRAALKGRAMLAAGFSWEDMRAAILAGWTVDELASVEGLDAE